MFNLTSVVESALKGIPGVPGLNAAALAREVSHLFAPKKGSIVQPDLPNRMSYIRITSKCNMKCPHCLFSCTESGENMPFDVFKRALDIAIRRNLSADDPRAIVSERPPILTHDRYFPVRISGGEPTLHPQFWTFIRHAQVRLRHYDFKLQVFTNGSMTKTSLLLAKLAKKGEFFVTVSKDPWHEPIALEVMEAFPNSPACGSQLLRSNNWDVQKKRWKTDLRGLLNLSHDLRNQGRAASLKDVETKDECLLPEFIFEPDGKIKFCGCDDSPVIGDVYSGIQEKYLRWPSNTCHKVAEMIVTARGIIQNFLGGP